MKNGKATVLVVEDDKDLNLLLRHTLERSGYRAVGVTAPERAVAAFRRERPALVMLDIMMPGIDGFEVCRLLRQESQVPIIMVSAKAREADRVLGLRLGADDYVAKPYSADELMARVGALLRRARPKPAAGADGALRAGEIELDVTRCEARVGGKLRVLTPKEFELLTTLLRADGRTLSREALLEKVWGHEQGLELDTRTVDQHVARLRRKLRAGGKSVVTVRGRGYKLAR